MASPQGNTLYKKKKGTLALAPDSQAVTWTPDTGGPATVTLPIASITNLQQTPDSSPRVMLKIFEKPANGGEPVTYLFHFHTPHAKEEARAIKDVLSRLLADLRASDAGVPRPMAAAEPGATAPNPVANGAGPSASMAFANAVNAQPPLARWFDDGQLKADIELQQSLMKTDPRLYRIYMEAMAAKPECISGAAFNTQFWSTRTNLLRAHAIEINQRKGAYNVLSTVKPRTVDGELKLNISVEQVQMIFAQHPLVKRIYNDNVPKLSEAEFWSRFFLSRLSKKLKGEHVTENDRPDALFDKYDVGENTEGFQSKIMAQRVPHIIDMQANEENQGGFKSGNARDVEMRPRANIPIVKTLNRLSEKIMANVAPSDELLEDGPNVYKGLSLRDLTGDAEEHRIMLKVKEQNGFFSRQESAPSANALLFAAQDPAAVLSTVRTTLRALGADGTAGGGGGLHAAVAFDDESDSDDEERRRPHVGSRAAIKAAEKEVMDGVLQQRSQKYGHASDATSPMGLSPDMADKCALTHATTVEFMHQFWNAFLSGDADRAAELQYLAESLQRSAARIDAVASEAEAEREAVIRKRKQDIRDHFECTGKKIRWKPDMVGGGRDAVAKMMQPTLDALAKAQADYSKALAAEGIQISTE